MDNGGEFASSAFRELLLKEGISAEYTSPYTPQQNGKAERRWRTLGDMTRTVLEHAELPESCWYYAMKTAGYIQNRVVSSVSQSGLTPIEVLTGHRGPLSPIFVHGDAWPMFWSLTPKASLADGPTRLY